MSALGLGLLLEVVFAGEHALVEDAGYEDAGCGLAEEDDVLAVLGAAEVWVEITAGAAARWIQCELLAVRLEAVEIFVCLGFAPDAGGVGSDVLEIELRMR